MLKNQEKGKQLLMFLATNYDETAFDLVVSTLKHTQTAVLIGGLTTAVIQGGYGQKQKPDYTISNLLKGTITVAFDAVLLAGGVQSINHLFADPRLHDLLTGYIAQGKRVGICQPLPYKLITSSPLFQTKQVKVQNGESHRQFITRFLEALP